MLFDSKNDAFNPDPGNRYQDRITETLHASAPGRGVAQRLAARREHERKAAQDRAAAIASGDVNNPAHPDYGMPW